MSGIAAILDLRGEPPSGPVLEPALRVLERRGPDGTATKTLGAAALACARLDTLPEDGPQPVTVRRVTVVADARLDNRQALERLLKLPASASEAELIAAAVARWGDAAPEKLEGDFAFIAWDGARLRAARDRFGVRPLFYHQTAQSILLASEVHAVTAHPEVKADVNRAYFLEQLAAFVPPTRRTPYVGVRRLMPGELLLIEPGRTPERRDYYRLPVGTRSMRQNEAAETTRNLLDEAVRLRLRATGPLACDVSGGMDSTSIYATARALGRTPQAISVVSDRWPSLDEREFSRELVGGNPWTWVMAEDYPPFGRAEAVALHFDEPMQDVIFETRLAMNRVLPEGCRVVLCGHGGDALMTGGIDVIRAHLKTGRWLDAYREARVWADLRDQPLVMALRRALAPQALSVRGLPWASPEVASEAAEVAGEVSRAYAQAARGSFDVVSFLASTETGLRQQPSAAVEMRYPFLHRPLVEHALATPAPLKARAGMGKRVLRRAMRERLPRPILERSLKSGYASAYACGARLNWPSIDSWLREPRLADLGVFSARGLRNLVEDFRDGHADHEMKVVYALVDEAWLRARLPTVSLVDLDAGRKPAARHASRPAGVGRR